MRGSRILGSLLALILMTGAACHLGGGRLASDDPSSCVSTAREVSIATGNPSGVYHRIGAALAEVVNMNTALTATTVETDASVRNVQRLVAGEQDLAFVLADTAVDAVTGRGSFTGPPTDIKALSRLYPNYTHVIVRSDIGVADIAGLRGRRVSTGSPGSGTEVIANRLLTAAGVNPATDVQPRQLNLTATVDAFRAGTIDAMFWSGGLPTAAITELTADLGERIRFLETGSLLAGMRKANPVYEIGLLPASTYGLAADVTTIVVPNLLVARGDLAVNDACAIVDAMFRNRGVLEQAHPAAKDITRETALNTDPVPVHLGARRALGAAPS